MSRCAQCPSLPWLVMQILFVVCFICVLVFILTRGDKKTEVRRRALSDIVLAQFKIIIGFYQVCLRLVVDKVLLSIRGDLDRRKLTCTKS